MTPTFSESLRAFRARHGFSQVKAAAALNATPATWECWEQERRKPRTTMRSGLLAMMLAYDEAHPTTETTNHSTL